MLDIIFFILLGVCILVVLFALFMMFRNEWNCSQRLYLIDHDLESYNKLPPYSTTLWKFWIWDIKKFIDKK